jgi:hypothetical protein
MRRILLIILFTAGVAFPQDTNKVVIDERSEKPMLMGVTTREAFSDTAFAWWYNSQYDLYEIDTTLINQFRTELADTDILIIMGTWCSDSRREVPHFLKILDYAEYPEDRFRMISVDRGKTAEGIDITELNIEYVPTFIFFRNDEEIGRIIETPKRTLEEDISEILEESVQ